MELRNNFIFAPVKTGYSDQTGIVTERHLKFYDARSKHVGAVIPEPFYIDKGLRELPVQMGIADDIHNEGLKKLTDTIHRNGAKVIAHLNHPGRMANPKIPGNYFISSTSKPCENGGAAPVAMDEEAMQQVENLFVNAAKRAEAAGFDYIEMQFGHGYLFAQFLSPAVNDRTDEYGGSLENRAKFPLRVLDAVKNAVNLPVIARISGDEMIPNGLKLDEVIKFVKMLKQHGVEAVHVSAGTVCSTPPWYFQHMFVPKGKTWQFAAKIKENIDIPVIFVGQINEFKDIDKLTTEFNADYIAVGRPLVADPDFVGKYLGEIKRPVRPCLACSEGCLGGVKSGKGLGCLVNPLVGKEDFKLNPAQTSKHIAVVGGGLAGMQAAITLKERGYQVTLFEKDKLGGQFNLAYLPPHKDSLKKLVDYMTEMIDYEQIPVIKKEPSAEELKAFDEIFIATGSKPAVPPIEGLDKYYWAEVLEDRNLPESKRVVVIGGGLIGTEVAAKLLQKGNKIFIVEMLDEVARGMEMIEKKLTMKALKENDVNIFVNTVVKKVDGDKVLLESKTMKQTLENIDLIVLATGMKSNNPFADKDLGDKVHLIGDAAKVGKAQDAISSAFFEAAEV